MIPDAPWIRDAELNGYPAGEDVELLCPCCGKEAESYYLDSDDNIIGCEECIRCVDACEWYGDHKEDDL